MGWNLLIHFNR